VTRRDITPTEPATDEDASLPSASTSTVHGWRPYGEVHPGPGHTVVGDVRVLQGLPSRELGNVRDITVYLPPSTVRDGRAAPVIYMHDGQNVFDEATSFAGELRADETMEALAREGLEAIVVGVANGGDARPLEYNAFDARGKPPARGDAYLRFLVGEVKPLIDRSFPTLPDRASTVLMGSSFGAAISLYGFLRHPTVFGAAGAMSLAGWWADHALLRYVTAAPYVPGRIWLDTGTREEGRSLRDKLLLGHVSRGLVRDTRRYRDALLAKGYRLDDDLRYVEAAGAVHNERDWARRLPEAIRYLLTGNV
jgi:predicted alpha/beta superfamily hydrolase